MLNDKYSQHTAVEPESSVAANLTPEKRALLTLLLRKKAAQEQKQDSPIEKISRDGELPLSFAQQRLWFLDQMEPDSAAYNMPFAMRLKGRLDVEALERSFNEIVQRHEALRTTFPAAAGQPMQVVAPRLNLRLETIDLREFPESEREPEARRLVAAEVQRPFDLAVGPLLRIGLIRLDEQDHIVLLTIHHIVSDGWSSGVFTREISALYPAFSTGKPSPLPPLPIQYVDFAHWQRLRLQSEVLESQLSYWKRQLGGAPGLLDLPTDRPRASGQTSEGAGEFILISKSLSDAVKEFSRRENATMFMTLLATFQTLLHRYCLQDDIVVGSPIANRNHGETEYLIGFFANTLVMRTDFSGDPTFRELLKRVRETALGAFANQDIAFDKLVEELQPERHAGRTPLFQTMFALQNAPAEELQLSGLLISRFAIESKSSKFDLLMSVTDTPQGLTVSLRYDTDLFNASTIKQALEDYRFLLEGFITNPDERLSVLTREIPVKKLRVAFAATYTADPLKESLEFWMEKLRIPSVISVAPYNQVFQQLLDPDSLLATNDEGINIILLRMEDWLDRAEESVKDFLAAMDSFRSRNLAPCFLCLCPASDDTEKSGLVQRVEDRIRQHAETLSQVYILNADEAAALYGVRQVNDPQTDEMGHIPYSPEFFASLGTFIARKILSLDGPHYKAIVLDCDATLWGGAVGEDDPELLSPYLALQSFMVTQHSSGIQLCLCSRNDEADVFEVFRSHTEMPLKLKHLASWRINWEAASHNIRSLASELRLSPSDIIYVSGNPIECAEARAHCPEALSLQLPQNPDEIPALLRHAWVFDH